MRQYKLPDGRIRIVYDYRGPSGPNHVKATLPAHTRIADIIKAKAELVMKAERRSLKFTSARFEEVVDIVTKQNGGAGMSWIYDRVRRELAGPIDTSFAARYNRYIDTLGDEKKKKNTISNHKAVIQRCLNTAYKRRMIDDIPVRDFGIRREFRDVVLTSAQRLKLGNVMVEKKSHLYWSIWFAERRPIRGLSDLWHLKRDNLVLFGEGTPYIRMKATKTGLDTVLPLADLPEIVEYFNSLPADCPYLFPRIINGKWYPMGDPRWHFAELKTAAGIGNFHFHDFKRMATMYMIEHGCTAEDLLNLGIYATRTMIDRVYTKRDAMSVLRRFSVDPASGREVKNVANL